MKMRVLWTGFCVALLLLLQGACGSKSVEVEKVPPMQINGVNVDIVQLPAEFSSASPEIQARVNKALNEVRYKRYVPAMQELDDLLNSPGLTDKQKKLVTKVIGQIKEVVVKEGQ